MKTIKKSSGLNESEAFLGELSEKTFLSLWSYPNVYRQPGKELADLLVIYQDTIVIFSDKQVECRLDVDVNTMWKRWFKKAVLAGALSVNGAKRWIEEHPDRVFLDAANSEPFPFNIADSPSLKFHLVSVSSGADRLIKRHFRDRSGTLMLSSFIEGQQHVDDAEKPPTPFMVGNVVPEKDFVHVMSRSALELVMSEFDTISDFVRYLDWRREGLLQKKLAGAPGEEELVALYWTKMRDLGWDVEELASFPSSKFALQLVGGLYRELSLDPDYLEWKLASEDSLFWDQLVERFAQYVLSGDVPSVLGEDPNFETSERVLRFLASEPRAGRIRLSNAFKGMMVAALQEGADRFVRKVLPADPEATHAYVFIVMNPTAADYTTYEEYREERANIAQVYCLDLLEQVPEINYAVAIAIDASKELTGASGSSEDVLAVERPIFDSDFLCQLEEAREGLGIEPIEVESLSRARVLAKRTAHKRSVPKRRKTKRKFRP